MRHTSFKHSSTSANRRILLGPGDKLWRIERIVCGMPASCRFRRERCYGLPEASLTENQKKTMSAAAFCRIHDFVVRLINELGRCVDVMAEAQKKLSRSLK